MSEAIPDGHLKGVPEVMVVDQTLHVLHTSRRSLALTTSPENHADMIKY